MEKKRVSGCLKSLIVAFLTIALVCLFGRNHFIFGTALIVCRWVFVTFGVLFLYVSIKRITPKYLQILIPLTLLFLLLEYSWNKINQQALKGNETKTEVSIMTYNLFFRKRSPKLSIQKIIESDPDILVVQELTPEMESQLNISIGKIYPYKKNLALKGTHGLGIYSKHRILTSQLLKNDSNLPFAQVVEVEIKSKKIQLINTHLASPAIVVENPEKFLYLLSSNYDLREYQIQKINSLIQEGEFDAQILIGDLNTTKYEPLFRKLKNNWVDLFDVSGIGSRLNFPNSSNTNPLLTLDYILLRGNLNGIEAKVIKGGSSDHLSIIGKVEM